MCIRVLSIAILISLCGLGSAQAQITDNVVKIGVLTDLSGPYVGTTGPGSVLAAKMAVEDFTATHKGLKIEVLTADHKNKPEVGAEIVRQWYDVDKVDVVVDVPVSSVALAVSQITREKNKVFLASGPGSSDLTGKACSPNTVHWTYDTWALANATGSVIVLTGNKSWTFLTADYAFGQALERDTEAAVVGAGGTVVSKIRYPFPTSDFSMFLKQAQASKAKIIGLTNPDPINIIKQGSELGIGKSGSGQRFAGLLVDVTDVDSLGLDKAQGLFLATAFYWDLNPRTRAWSKRFFDQHKRMPTMIQAGVYAAVTHYLKAVEALQSDDGIKVVNKMKEVPTNDPLFGVGRIRRDGRKIHRLYLFEVKQPSESKGSWDYYKRRGIVPADTAFRPEKDGGCPLVK